MSNKTKKRQNEALERKKSDGTSNQIPTFRDRTENVGDGINIGGFEIKYYGMIIATGFLLGLIVSYYAAKHENKFDPELVFDYLITMIIPAIVGARLYYVIFSWDYYKNHLSEIIQIRNGGLAIYGGVIAGAITLYIFCKKKHLSMLQFGDVAVKGLLVGQILGRWGNFFNREAFGSYTNSLFAMQIPTNFFIEHGRIDEIVSMDCMIRQLMLYLEMKQQPLFRYIRHSYMNLCGILFYYC